MKIASRIICLFTLTILLSFSSNKELDQNRTQKKWELVFEDNFDKNLKHWNVWKSGAFNDEIQLYTKKQLIVKKGILYINTKRKQVTGAATPFNPNKAKFSYVSGRIESKVQYGPSDAEGEKEYRFMAKIQLPKGLGMWPAFWTYSDPWPTKGEIDIFEGKGNQPNGFQSNVLYGTKLGLPTSAKNEKRYKDLPDLTANFHIYELIWSQNKLTIKLDNEILSNYTEIENNKISDFFGNKHKIVLNTAVGGVFFPNFKDSSAYVDEAQMKIDWVKVYKR